MAPTLFNAPPGILDLLAQNNGHYEVVLPPLETVFPITIITELQFDGRPQDSWKIYLPRQARFASKEVQGPMRRAVEGWQSGEWGRDVEDEGEYGLGRKDSVGGIWAEERKRKAEGWRYQTVPKGEMPGKVFTPLTTEREWRVLKGFVVEVEGEVVVWEARCHAEMLRRRERVKEMIKNDEVDFHNACELGISPLDGGELFGTGRAMSGVSAAAFGDDHGDGELDGDAGVDGVMKIKNEGDAKRAAGCDEPSVSETKKEQANDQVKKEREAVDEVL